MRRVVLHIDRLRLRGVSRAEVPALSAGLRGELESLLARDAAIGALSGQHASHLVRAGTVRIPHDAGARALGRAVAGRIVRMAKP